MDRITAARVLIETVERGSATAAAEELDMSRAMASRYIASIEDWSGTRLLHRTTRQLSLTSAGERVLELCKEMVRIADTVSDVAADAATPRGRLRVTAPSILAEALLIPRLADFAKAYQHIKIDLLISDRPVDLVQDRIDVAIRIANSLDLALIAKRLSKLLWLHGVPWRSRQKVVRLFKGEGRIRLHKFLHRPKTLIVELRDFLMDCIRLGIAMLPCFSSETDVAEGRLQRVLEEWQPESMGIHALYVSRRHLPMAARVLIDFLSARMNR